MTGVWSILVTLAALAPSGEATCMAGSIQVHLPRQVEIDQRQVTLGRIAVLRGDPTLVAKAQAVALGQLLMPGQTLGLTRATILARLVSEGLPASAVTVTGAQDITVSKTHRLVTGQDLADLAKAHLVRCVPDPCTARIALERMPLDWPIDSTDPNLRWVCRAASKGPDGRVRIRVAAQAQGRDLATRDVDFRVQYPYPQVIAKGPLAKGQTLSPDNVTVQQGLREIPAPSDWKPPFGQVAKRAVADGAEIRADWIEMPVPPVLVKRNDTVTIRIEYPGLTITAKGQALTDARGGELIKVRNDDSQRVVLCMLKGDGTVEPVQ